MSVQSANGPQKSIEQALVMSINPMAQAKIFRNLFRNSTR